jgi:hypothetical protein
MLGETSSLEVGSDVWLKDGKDEVGRTESRWSWRLDGASGSSLTPMNASYGPSDTGRGATCKVPMPLKLRLRHGLGPTTIYELGVQGRLAMFRTRMVVVLPSSWHFR